MSDTVMRVNGSPVSRYEMNMVLQEFALDKGGEEPDDRPPREELETLARERLVARELIYQQALSEGVVADESEVVEECRRAIKGFRSEQDFLEALAKADGDPAVFQRSIRKDLTVAKMSRSYLAAIASPSDEEILAFYREHPEHLEYPATYDLRQLLVVVEVGSRDQALKQAVNLKERAEAEDFIALIREFSDCPSALKDGVLAGVRTDQMAPQLQQVVDGLEPGEIGGPVETDTGFHLVERLDYRAARIPQLEECRAQIVDFLQREHKTNKLSAWVEKLQKEAIVEHLTD